MKIKKIMMMKMSKIIFAKKNIYIFDEIILI